MNKYTIRKAFRCSKEQSEQLEELIATYNTLNESSLDESKYIRMKLFEGESDG